MRTCPCTSRMTTATPTATSTGMRYGRRNTNRGRGIERMTAMNYYRIELSRRVPTRKNKAGMDTAVCRAESEHEPSGSFSRRCAPMSGRSAGITPCAAATRTGGDFERCSHLGGEPSSIGGATGHPKTGCPVFDGKPPSYRRVYIWRIHMVCYLAISLG